MTRTAPATTAARAPGRGVLRVLLGDTVGFQAGRVALDAVFVAVLRSSLRAGFGGIMLRD